MPKNLSQIAKQKKIKYFLISFVDLFGVLRSKLVPAQAIAEMQKNGAEIRFCTGVTRVEQIEFWPRHPLTAQKKGVSTTYCLGGGGN